MVKKPTVELTHPEATRERLLAYASKVPGARIGLKIAALLLTLEGQRPGWIAEVLGQTRQSLNRWMHKVNSSGLQALLPLPKSGRPAALTRNVAKDLAHCLERSPMEVGLKRAQWDGPTLGVYLKQRFGITLNVRQAQRWLHQLGYRLKQAGHVYIQARADEAKRFQRKLKKTSDARAP